MVKCVLSHLSIQIIDYRCEERGYDEDQSGKNFMSKWVLDKKM